MADRKIIKVIWNTSFFIILFIFLSRFAVSSFCKVNPPETSVLYFFICCIILYTSFIVEGIILAVSKIEDYDDAATIAEMIKRNGTTDSIGPNLLKMKIRCKQIMVGQPILAIALAFIFNEIFQKSGIKETTSCSCLPPYIKFIYNSNPISIIVSTMLIYWVSQILPQSLGNKSSAEFIKIRGAMLLADGLFFIAQTGIGKPGEMLEGFAEKLGYDTRPFALPLGNSAFLKAMSADYERYVEERRIIIEPKEDGIYVTDTAKHIYITERKEVEHVFRVAISQLNEGEAIDIDINFPEGIIYEELNTRTMYSNVFDQNVMKSLDQQNKMVGSSSSANLLWGEYIIASKSSSDESIRYTSTSSKYKLRTPKFSTNDSKDTLYFYLGLPTEKIVIIVKDPEGVFIKDVDLNFFAEDSKIFEVLDPIQRGTKTSVRDKESREWIVTHNHPPLATEMRVVIDARTISGGAPIFSEPH